MSQRLLDDLGRAAHCVSLLSALGADVKDAFIGKHGPTINLAEPGELMRHLDVKQTPVVCAVGSHMAVIDGCLVSWPAR